MKFDELGLASAIVRAVTAEGYTTPTPIQAKAIPHVLAGRDLLGCAQTGTGKTAAFALPIIHRLMRHGAAEAGTPGTPGTPPRHDARHPAPHRHDAHRTGLRRRIRALILAPTRELAAQIGESFTAYGRQAHLRHVVVFGGVGQGPQVNALRDGVDILVATPGRLLDLMGQGFVDLGAVEVFVLDEADRMLDMGFIPDIRKIVTRLPAAGQRQTLLFSATMPRDIRDLANSILRNPLSVEVATESPTADRIDQAVYFVEKRNKPLLMIHLLENVAFTRVLVFTRTKHGADKVARQLFTAGIHAEAIHGNKSQNARQRSLANFKSGKTPVLIASDIAARGIDIDEISHVVNFDLPNVPETYVHRIGRTARAGASGIAISFCDHEERPFLRDIERLTRVTIPVREDHPVYPARSEMPEAFREGRDSRSPRQPHNPRNSQHPRSSRGSQNGGHQKGQTNRANTSPQGQGQSRHTRAGGQPGQGVQSHAPAHPAAHAAAGAAPQGQGAHHAGHRTNPNPGGAPAAPAPRQPGHVQGRPSFRGRPRTN